MNHNKCNQCLFYFIFSVKKILTLQICNVFTIQCLLYSMGTCGTIWNEFNECIMFKNICKTLQPMFSCFSKFKWLAMPPKWHLFMDNNYKHLSIMVYNVTFLFFINIFHHWKYHESIKKCNVVTHSQGSSCGVRGHVQIFNHKILIRSHPLFSCDKNEKEWGFEMMLRIQQWYSLTKIKGLDNEQ
jgi:hypothetical protein